MNLLTLQSDYPVLSLSSIGAPVEIIEVPVLDVRVVEGMEGVMVLDDEAMDAAMVTEETLQGTVVVEEAPTAVLVDEQQMSGTFVGEETMVGVFDPGDC